MAAIAWKREGEAVPRPSFDAVFGAVEGGECSYGVVPIENSLAGSIHGNYDLLLRHQLSIVGEVSLRIVHNLIALPGVKLADIHRVYSHPQALAQCERYLEQLEGVEPVPTYNTAASVKFLAERNIRDGAAIASSRAARLYDMEVVAEGIEDDPKNYTRFIALGSEQEIPQGDSKTSVVFAVENAPGSLFKSLSVFALRDIDLTKIESRPMRGEPWQYLFYMDFAGSMAESKCQNAIRHLEEIATFLRILGSYPRGKNYNEEDEVTA
jgi:prephenate dehydratase